MPTRGKESYSIQSVENALDVLEAICEEGDDFRVSQLSDKLGMNKTSVFRLLATLENRGYVEREEGSSKYRLGLAAYEIGQKFLLRMELLRQAHPVMERLARTCNEAIYLAVRRDADVLFLDMIDTSLQVKIVSLTGKRFPLSSNAAGRVILAHTPEQPGRGGNGGRPALAKEERQTILQRGADLSRGALGEGVTCLAVPLFNRDGQVAGSLCLIGPEFRLPAELLETQLLPQLRDTGEIISSKLGYFSQHLKQGLT